MQVQSVYVHLTRQKRWLRRAPSISRMDRSTKLIETQQNSRGACIFLCTKQPNGDILRKKAIQFFNAWKKPSPLVSAKTLKCYPWCRRCTPEAPANPARTTGDPSALGSVFILARKDAGCSKGASCTFCHLCEALGVHLDSPF